MDYDFKIIRNLRKSHGMTIAQVAKKSGISTAVISRLERNQATPELPTLYRIGRVFGASATELLGLAEPSTTQRTQSKRYLSGGFQFKKLSFPNFQCFLGTAATGGLALKPEMHHNDHEICWVLQGSVEVTVDGIPHAIGEGEAIRFNAMSVHGYKALAPCKILIVHQNKSGAL